MKINDRIQRMKKNYKVIQKVMAKQDAPVEWYDMLVNLQSPTYSNNPQLLMKIFGECHNELTEFNNDITQLYTQFGSLEHEIAFVTDLVNDLKFGNTPTQMDVERIEMCVDRVRRELDV